MKRPPVTGEAGTTLVELLVVLMLTSIIGAIIYSVLINVTAVTARADHSTTAENNGRIALRSLSEDLRAAVQIRVPTSSTACPTGATYPAGFAYCVEFLVPHEISATATSTTIAAAAKPIGCPFSRIVYGIKGGVLREDRTDYDASCQIKASYTGRPVLDGVDNSASQPLFVFYDGYGNQLGASNAVDDYAAAGSVSVQIFLNYQTGAPDVSLVTTAALRNNR